MQGIYTCVPQTNRVSMSQLLCSYYSWCT
jgi:hypothetical protein